MYDGIVSGKVGIGVCLLRLLRKRGDRSAVAVEGHATLKGLLAAARS